MAQPVQRAHAHAGHHVGHADLWRGGVGRRRGRGGSAGYRMEFQSGAAAWPELTRDGSSRMVSKVNCKARGGGGIVEVADGQGMG